MPATPKINPASFAVLLRVIVARDGWTAHAASAPALLVAQHGRRRITFFAGDAAPRALTAALRAIQRADRNRFDQLGVVVASNDEILTKLRRVACAKTFPRAFFASLDELRDLAAGRIPFTPEKSGGMVPFFAKVLINDRVGEPGSPLYRLAFTAPELHDILPPQFVMMDTMTERVPLGSRVVRHGTLRGALTLAPRPLLKRPFGICRDFHPQFPMDYLTRLNLPPTLALALHPPAADHFDMLYKVLPDGIGTPLMTQLKPGQRVRMLGPLGRPFDVRRLRAEGVTDVHIIGGGVGMAPLILLVESLRYYAFNVKIFLGIAKFRALRYRDELAATFGEKPRAAYVYVDDLIAAGVKPADIFVACDSEPPAKNIRGIPRANLFQGLVPEQYRQFLAANAAARGPQVRAFTCGPNRMMELVTDITNQADVRLHVLLEKRMACGIGVCFSCVCKVRRPGGVEDYARICTEGPLFDAKDILWKNDDSKQPSANCGCAPRS